MFPITVHLMDIMRRQESRPRPVLQDITSEPQRSRAVYSDGNVSPFDFYFASADELIIQQRSRGYTPGSADLSSSFCFSEDCSAESSEFLQITPEKSDTFPGSVRKRLCLSSPDLRRVKKSAVSPAKRKLGAIKSSLTFTDELQAFSKDQLVSTLGKLVTNHPELETEIRESLNLPDLKPLKDRLAHILQIIYRLLPSSRWDTGRGAYSFRKVRSHLMLFKKSCTEQLRIFAACKYWETIVYYVLMAWKYVGKLPNWEDSQHNQIKTRCFVLLASCCSNALKRGKFTCQELMSIRSRLQQCQHLNAVIKPSIKFIEQQLQEVL